MTSVRCSPSPIQWQYAPKTELDCSTKYSKRRWLPLPSELRALASELADELPDWSSTEDPSVDLDYDGLKAAAIKVASAASCVRWAVIETYSKEYCEPTRIDLAKASGMYLLMRVLFVLPSDYPIKDVHVYSTWSHPVRTKAERTSKWDLSWPVHAKPGENVLEIERCQGFPGSGRPYRPYDALTEYRYFRMEKHFRMRTPAEIEALEIRGHP